MPPVITLVLYFAAAVCAFLAAVPGIPRPAVFLGVGLFAVVLPVLVSTAQEVHG